ncbi:MAG: ROK family protein [Alphaproteobacteria bacterium]|jgi:predicted NBD/HSP70 family sugar kinase|nr:ROK family protein [Alphaproteobacteria bacterium]
MPTGLWEWLDGFDAVRSEMDAWRDFNAPQDLADLLPGPISVENDATAACWAEWAFGDQTQKPDSIYFFIGTFVGGGIVLNGRVFRGCHGNAGGFGPVRVPDQPGGSRLIDHASLIVLERMLRAAGRRTNLADLPAENWSSLEPVLSDWIKRVSIGLAHAIISSAAVIDFAEVIIDGPFPANLRDRLCTEVDAQLDRMDLQGIMRPRLAPGSFGSVARALGAAATHISQRYMVDNPQAPLG